MLLVLPALLEPRVLLVLWEPLVLPALLEPLALLVL